MKRFIALVLVMTTAALASAAPTKADKALVEKYKDTVFSPGDQAPTKDYGNQKYYRLPNKTQMWVFTNGFIIVETPDKVSIQIQMTDDGREYSRMITLPDGRECTVDAEKNVEWGLVMEPAPDFTLGVLGASEQKITLSGCRGKLVVLDFWASWCKPCMAALPDTQALYTRFKDKGVLVFGINIEGDTAKASAAARSLNLTFPVLMGDPDKSGEYNWQCRQITDYHIHGIPALFLIDGDGVVMTTNVDEKTIEQYLNK